MIRWPWVSRSLYEEALRDKRIAEDRLYAAWKDGYIVPPRQSVVPAEVKGVELLPAKLQAYVQNWESQDTRQELETEARRLHYDLGMPEERVLELFLARNGHEG